MKISPINFSNNQEKTTFQAMPEGLLAKPTIVIMRKMESDERYLQDFYKNAAETYERLQDIVDRQLMNATHGKNLQSISLAKTCEILQKIDQFKDEMTQMLYQCGELLKHGKFLINTEERVLNLPETMILEFFSTPKGQTVFKEIVEQIRKMKPGTDVNDLFQAHKMKHISNKDYKERVYALPEVKETVLQLAKDFYSVFDQSRINKMADNVVNSSTTKTDSLRVKFY